MTKRLQPIRLDAYKPLREVVSETLRVGREPHTDSRSHS